jgi:hypothetical protein
MPFNFIVLPLICSKPMSFSSLSFVTVLLHGMYNEDGGSVDILVHIHNVTWHHIPDNGTLYGHIKKRNEYWLYPTMNVWNLRFSQCCCWRFKYCWRWVIPVILKYHSAFIISIKQSKKSTLAWRFMLFISLYQSFCLITLCFNLLLNFSLLWYFQQAEQSYCIYLDNIQS